MEKVKRIFVSGGTGYIGSHLVRALLEQGNVVHALVRNPDDIKLLEHPNLNVFKGDMLHGPDVDSAMDGCEQAYHLAAKASVWSSDPASFYDINVGATMTVLECAKRHNVKRVVVTGTAGVYGPSIRGPVTEMKVRDLDFLNEYEGSKLFAEARIKDYVLHEGLDVIVVSPTRVYGPYLLGKMGSFTFMIDRYVNGNWRFYPGRKQAIGNYIYINDVVKGHLLAMENGKKGETYILGGENASNYDLLKYLADSTGKRRMLFTVPYWFQMLYARIQIIRAKWFGIEPKVAPKWVRKGQYNFEVDASKAKSHLGLSPIPMREGIQRTVNWAQSKDIEKVFSSVTPPESLQHMDHPLSES